MEKKKKAELILLGVLVVVALVSILVARQSRISYRKLERSVEERVAKLASPSLGEAKAHLKQAVVSARESNFGDAARAVQKAKNNIERVLSASGRQTKGKIQKLAGAVKKIEKEVAAGKKEIGAKVGDAIRMIDAIILPKAKKS